MFKMKLGGSPAQFRGNLNSRYLRAVGRRQQRDAGQTSGEKGVCPQPGVPGPNLLFPPRRRVLHREPWSAPKAGAPDQGPGT